MKHEITTYIQRNSTPQSLQKGKLLFSKQRVKSLQLNSGNNTYKATVKGSKLYNTAVGFSTNNSVTFTSCNCLYDWGGLCKHKVATLFAISDLGNDAKGIVKKTKKIKTALLLPNDADLTEKVLDEVVNDKIYDQMQQKQWELEINEFEAPDKLQAKLSDNYNYWDSGEYIITFTREKKRYKGRLFLSLC